MGTSMEKERRQAQMERIIQAIGKMEFHTAGGNADLSGLGIEYEGEWKNGLQQGSGVLYNEKE